jgi:hypothetical protein
MSTNARERVAILLASGWTIKGTARKVKLNERTIRRWVEKSDDFKRRIAELRQQMTSRAVGKLTAASTEAAAELRKQLKSPDDKARRDAAKIILSQRSKLGEIEDLEGRIAAIDERLEKAGL